MSESTKSSYLITGVKLAITGIGIVLGTSLVLLVAGKVQDASDRSH